MTTNHANSYPSNTNFFCQQFIEKIEHFKDIAIGNLNYIIIIIIIYFLTHEMEKLSWFESGSENNIQKSWCPQGMVQQETCVCIHLRIYQSLITPIFRCFQRDNILM